MSADTIASANASSKASRIHNFTLLVGGFFQPKRDTAQGPQRDHYRPNERHHPLSVPELRDEVTQHHTPGNKQSPEGKLDSPPHRLAGDYGKESITVWPTAQ